MSSESDQTIQSSDDSVSAQSGHDSSVRREVCVFAAVSLDYLINTSTSMLSS